MSPLSGSDAEQNVARMTAVIKEHALATANKLREEGEREFQDHVMAIVKEEKVKISSALERERKKLNVEMKIESSKSTNKQRVQKMTLRQQKIDEISSMANKQLKAKLQSMDQGRLVTNLIVQGLLKLLEQEVVVKCRKADQAVVQKCLTQAQDAYAKAIAAQTGAKKVVRLTLAQDSLPDSIMGGVHLSCDEGRISIDNTLDARLKLVMEQDKPAIRASLFPQA